MSKDNKIGLDTFLGAYLVSLIPSMFFLLALPDNAMEIDPTVYQQPGHTSFKPNDYGLALIFGIIPCTIAAFLLLSYATHLSYQKYKNEKDELSKQGLYPTSFIEYLCKPVSDAVNQGVNKLMSFDLMPKFGKTEKHNLKNIELSAT